MSVVERVKESTLSCKLLIVSLCAMIDILSGAPHFLLGLFTGVAFTTIYYSYRRWCPGLLRPMEHHDGAGQVEMSYCKVNAHSGSVDSNESMEVEMSSISNKLPSDDLDDVFTESSAFDSEGRFRVRDGVYKPHENPFAMNKI